MTILIIISKAWDDKILAKQFIILKLANISPNLKRMRL